MTQSIFKYLTLFIFAILLSPVIYSQGDLLILGTVRNDDSAAKLEGTVVSVTKDGSSFDNLTTSKNGKYEFAMPLGHVYQLRYSKEGFAHKILQFDTKNMNPEDFGGGFEMIIDVVLFEVADEFNLTIMDAPQGKCAYDPISNSLAWDSPYTEKMRYKVEDEIKRVEDLLANREKNQKEFDELIEKGDDKMMDDKFEDAIQKYKGALNIFPNDEKAKEKLADAELKFEESKKNKAADAEYEGHIADGNKSMKNEEWEKAKKSFESALALKPGESIPKNKLKEIENILANMMKRGEYNELVDAGDAKFNSEDYKGAIKKYEAALDVLSTETYPREKIKEAEAIIKELEDSLAAQEKLDREYDELISFGASSFKKEQYEIALSKYEQASELKPEEELPIKKINEINDILTELAALEEKNSKDAAEKAENDRIEKEYNDLIDQGNDLFKKKSLAQSKEKFEAALLVKPNDKYAENKIDTINEMMEELAANEELEAAKSEEDAEAARIDKAYKELIDAADDLFEGEDWTAAKSKYEEALYVKSSEKYPRQRISQIDERIAEEAKNKEKNDELAALEEKKKEDEARRKAEEERLAAELAEKQRKLDEMKNAEEEEDLASNDDRDFKTIEGDSDAEVIKFFKDAREKEERAKYKEVEDLRLREKKMQEDLNSQSNLQRQENLSDIEAKNQALETIELNGEDLRQKNVVNMNDKKKENEENQDNYVKKSNYKRERNIDEVEDKQTEYEGLASNDRYRIMKVEQTERDIERINDQSDSFKSKGDANRVDNMFALDAKREEINNMEYGGEDRRIENVGDVEAKQEEIKTYYKDLEKASAVQRERNIDEVEEDTRQAESIGKDQATMRQEGIAQVELTQTKVSSFQKEQELDAKMRRVEQMEALKEKGESPKKDLDDYSIGEEEADFEYGVTESSRVQGNKTIIVRTVRQGNKVDTYKKVISKTGIYYFKNGVSITSDAWEIETVLVYD